MSHSSKWTFKDKGFLFCKLQLTAFNSQRCSGFPSSPKWFWWIFPRANYSTNHWRSGDVYDKWGDGWRNKKPNPTQKEPEPWITLQFHTASFLQETFPVCQIEAPSLGTQCGILCDSLDAVHVPFPGAKLIKLWSSDCDMCRSYKHTFLNIKIHFKVVFRKSFEDIPKSYKFVPFKYLFLIFSSKSKD